jgi:hypothetical protein
VQSNLNQANADRYNQYQIIKNRKFSKRRKNVCWCQF